MLKSVYIVQIEDMGNGYEQNWVSILNQLWRKEQVNLSKDKRRRERLTQKKNIVFCIYDHLDSMRDSFNGRFPYSCFSFMNLI